MLIDGGVESQQTILTWQKMRGKFGPWVKEGHRYSVSILVQCGYLLEVTFALTGINMWALLLMSQPLARDCARVFDAFLI